MPACAFAALLAFGCRGDDADGNAVNVDDVNDGTSDSGDLGPEPEPENPDPPDRPDAPPDPVDNFAEQLDHVDVAELYNAVHFVAYDADDIEIGRIAVELEEETILHLVSQYPDGEGIVTVDDGELIAEGSLPSDVLERRAHAIVDVYASQDQKGALKCAVTVASAAALCAPLAAGHPLGAFTCPAGIIIAWCGCAEVLGLDDGGLCEDF